MEESIHERIEGASSTLLCAPSRGGTGACVDLLSTASVQRDVLWVTYTRSPAECLASWRDRVDEPPAWTAVLVLGEHVGAGGADAPVDAIETVDNPSDLTGAGIAIGELVDEGDAPISVCFDSITTLLQYVDVETAYEFLHVLVGQLYAADAVSHFHVNPAAHDERTITTLTPLFDATVELDDEEVTVRTRRLSSS